MTVIMQLVLVALSSSVVIIEIDLFCLDALSCHSNCASNYLGTRYEIQPGTSLNDKEKWTSNVTNCFHVLAQDPPVSVS
jgi:coenzyme F420-reducing hydrogenase gamma subunit